MKTILVPTDFSECAGQGVRVAQLIAQRTGASINFLHIKSIPPDWVDLPIEDQERLYPDVSDKVNAANSLLEKLASEEEHLGHDAKTFLHFNKGANHIAEFASEQQADLIVMGSHGATGGLKGLFVGTNTQKVVRRSSVPVLVVKNLTRYFDIKDIVFASGFSIDALGGFSRLVRFARQMGAKIHMVYINTPFTFISTDAIMQKVKPFEEEGGDLVKSFEVYNCSNFEEGLAEYCKRHGDLLAMETIGRKGVYRLYYGNTIEALINHLEVPILSINIGVVPENRKGIESREKELAV